MEGFLQFWENEGLRGFFYIFWFYFLLEFPRHLLLDYLLLPIIYLNKKKNQKADHEARRKLWEECPLVSIIIPGKDEGKNYYNLVTSLQEQTYRNFEVIVVDDGSGDDTKYIGRDLEQRGKIDLFLRNEVRGGKGSAANLALNYTRGKYILHLDADCSFFNDAIEEAILPFYKDENIGAVSCALEVRNSGESLATAFQTIEYLLTINVGRMVSSSLGILRIVSGAFGAFRKDLLLEVGGWDVGPGLDGDITQKIRKTKWKVVFAPKAVALTDVPVTFSKLAKQRLRWNRSLVRFRLRKHRNIFFPNKGFRFSNFFSSLDNIVYNQVLNFIWWFYLVFLIFNHRDHLEYILIAIFLLYTISKFLEFGVVLFVSHHKYDKIKLLPYLPGMVFYTGYFMRTIRTYAHITELFLYSSFNDPWNPQKSSSEAKKIEKDLERVF
ncbi:MAG TPA: glycosyltransferase [Flavobacteriaceae bacterium]|nr:glycosyltransferase [Flavobacteriaceae bacterium]